MKTLISLLESLTSSKSFDCVAFYPYTSIVIHRIAETNVVFKTHQEYTQEENVLLAFYDAVCEKLAIDIPTARLENKIVIEIRLKMDSLASYAKGFGSLFVGYKDNNVSVGLGYFQDEWLKDRNIRSEK